MMEQIHLDIDGMSCGHCVAGVKRALDSLGGVTQDVVRVGAAEVSYDAARVHPDAIVAAITSAGFPARLAATPA